MNALIVFTLACVAVASAVPSGIALGHGGLGLGVGPIGIGGLGLGGIGLGGLGLGGVGLGGLGHGVGVVAVPRWPQHGHVGPSGVVTGHGASGPSGVVTGAGAAGPAGVVNGHGAIGPNGDHSSIDLTGSQLIGGHGLGIRGIGLGHGIGHW